MTYNMKTAHNIITAPTMDSLELWVKEEIAQLPEQEATLIFKVISELDKWVRFPAEGKVLMPACDRTIKYHSYPDHIKAMAKERKIYLDTRANGPAAASFLIFGGERPSRRGNNNSWSIHHLYSGKFPHPGKTETTHAVKSGDHFTHSGGLVAIHPVADSMADEYAAFTWYLRALAFKKFGYDPDNVFNESIVKKAS